MRHVIEVVINLVEINQFNLATSHPAAVESLSASNRPFQLDKHRKTNG